MRNIFIFILLIFLGCSKSQQPFLHPGIDLNQKDLDYIKKQVLEGVEPWRGAYERLKERTQIDIEYVPETHIRGGWGDVGGKALLTAVNTFYDCALIWYISGEEQYAQKAIQILEQWSEHQLFFDGNDAKLVSGTAAYPICAGAEILRYFYGGWTNQHTEKLSHMMMESLYIVTRFYFSEANGNWDGVIARAHLAIAVFTDNRELFNGAVDHLLHAPANGSIFKYIYPSGECQETPRDLAHILMGLCEFSGAARIAYTQKVDLFSAGNNRLALGFEYTMNVFFGGQPQSYGFISTRQIDYRRDDIEYPYQHYTAKGVKMPLTGRMCEEERNNFARSVLIGFREEFHPQKSAPPTVDLLPSPIAYPAGATNKPAENIFENAIEVQPGDDLQDALDRTAGTGQMVVVKAGIHKLKRKLNIPSGVKLTGEGLESILMFEGVGYYALSAKESSMHDVRISNLVIDGSTTHEIPSDPNSGRFNRAGRYGNTSHGIAFLGQKPGSMKNIVFENVTVIHFSRHGVFITGAENIEINNCNISDNGSKIVPGPRLQHNMLLRHVNQIRIRDSRFDTSLAGCGIALSNCSDAMVERCEIARNAWFGLLLSTSENVTISGNLIEGNSASGIMSEYLYSGCRNVNINKNIIQYNDGYGIEAYAAEKIGLIDNQYHLNGQCVEQENINKQPKIILK